MVANILFKLISIVNNVNFIAGGAIGYLSAVSLEHSINITSCHFTGNSAAFGAAIAQVGGFILLLIFETVTKINIIFKSPLLIDNCMFKHNNGTSSGAVSVLNRRKSTTPIPVVIINTNFTRNGGGRM